MVKMSHFEHLTCFICYIMKKYGFMRCGNGVSTVASQREGSRFNSHLGPFCVEFVCSPRVCVGSLRYSGFLPPPKNMHVGLIGDSKIVLRSERVWLFVSFVSVMDWRPVQGEPRLSPDDRWDRFQPPRRPD